MTIEENKKLVSQFFACFSANDCRCSLTQCPTTELVDLSKPEHLPAAGDHTKDRSPASSIACQISW